MHTPWIGEERLARALKRNEAFWRGELEELPLLWVTVPNAKPGPTLPEPECEALMWTDVDYVLASTELALSRTYYAGDALPVFNPWLGPDQFAAWLGADIVLKPKEFTSWVTPLIEDWDDFSELKMDPNNRWWQIYLDTLKASVEAGKEKWVTGYPDLHTGMDAMSALRGPEKLTLDLIDRPEVIHRAMRQVTDLWREVVDTVSEVVLPGGQGTSNWTMGWSEKRFLCIGQNDFTCMIGRPMFETFCLMDNVECCNHVDYSLYHLDGPGATRHLPAILEIESLTAIQWIQGAGNPPPSKWLEMLQTIQRAGKGVQLYYGPNHGDDVDLLKEIEILCQALDVSQLFVWATVGSVEQADAILLRAEQVCRKR